MKEFAKIRNRPTWIVGFPQSGWGTCDPEAAGAKLMDFDFSILSDGDTGFHLDFRSCDGVYFNENWHETIDDAYATAETAFGISKADWMKSGT